MMTHWKTSGVRQISFLVNVKNWPIGEYTSQDSVSRGLPYGLPVTDNVMEQVEGCFVQVQETDVLNVEGKLVAPTITC